VTRIGSTVERLLVRTWNLFHGNTKPPGRKAFLDEMIRLAVVDAPHVVCLQEVPVWALRRLAAWSGMTAVGDVARRPSVGPFPSTPEIGRVLTDINHGLFRSLFTGQANAVLLHSDLELLEHRRIVLNPFRFRRAQARKLGLERAARLAWSVERRVCQALRVRNGEHTFVLANLHATSYGIDKRLADAELLRAAAFVDGMARPEEPVILGGDFNLSVRNSRTLGDLMTPEWGFSGATPMGIDHVLVRGLRTGEPRIWPAARRMHGGQLLSDHAPVEVDVE
jgi:endonuclease/exonuclease/phosphatase family metal-dependent hydrolase